MRVKNPGKRGLSTYNITVKEHAMAPCKPREVPQNTNMNPGDAAPPGTPGTGENLCPQCSGRGRIDGEECPTCGGSGKVIEGIGGA